jgi:uncharacterized protein with GYD domain
MPFYLIEVSYTDAAAKTMVKDPQPRENQTRSAAESLGGKLHSFFFAFGEYDAIAIVEMPDNQSAAALALTGLAGEALSKFRTTVLLTAAEGEAAMRKAKTAVYSPPA